LSTLSFDLDEKASILSDGATSATVAPFDRLSLIAQSKLKEIHTMIEGAYARVMDLEVSPFTHAPYFHGYWPERYFEDSRTRFCEWMASTSFIPNQIEEVDPTI
jgi:hypothetical protein